MAAAVHRAVFRCGSYDREELEERLGVLLESLGGMGRFIVPGERVLLKPNLLSASAPEQCITTHPEVLRAVALRVLEVGGRPFIGDSPGLDGFAGVAAKTGMAEVARELGIPCMELDEPSPLPMAEGSVFRKVEVSKKALEADKIINLPKLKTHAQMLLTLSVKNLFGTVVRQKKASWHYTVGLDRDVFADLHIDIARSLSPAITIMDGVMGMEGRGPGNGRPRQFGLLAASGDPLALDMHLCKMLGADLRSFPLYRAATRWGLISEEATEAKGDFPADFVFEGVDIPRLDSLHLLSFMPEKLARRHLSSRPVQLPEACIGCLKCVEVCPADAMTMREGNFVQIDYTKCIRCYCCQEVCPADAIRFSKGFLLKLLEMLGR
ncbi:MAG: DUF362 domain-containing protein [Synergistaceae bacterium]|nr:DUF362 domain-containing protein [Synergistaceae bacterium]